MNILCSHRLLRSVIGQSFFRNNVFRRSCIVGKIMADFKASSMSPVIGWGISVWYCTQRSQLSSINTGLNKGNLNLISEREMVTITIVSNYETLLYKMRTFTNVKELAPCTANYCNICHAKYLTVFRHTIQQILPSLALPLLTFLECS